MASARSSSRRSTWICGAVGADRDDDQVAVPGCELLELGEQLLALGAALRPADALLRLAGRELERLHLDLFELLRAGAHLARAGEERARGVGRLEAVGVDGARLRDQHRPAGGGVAVEQPLEAVEPSRRDAGERGLLLLAEPGRARLDRIAHRPLGQPAERHELAARADRLGDRPEVVGDEHDHRVGRRLFQVLEQRRRRRRRSSGRR